MDAGPQASLQWLGSLDKEGSKAVGGYVTSRLVKDKPDKLVRMGRMIAAGETPLDVDREQLTAQAVRGWIGANPNAMGDWLKNNRNAPRSDEIAVPYVNQIRSTDP